MKKKALIKSYMRYAYSAYSFCRRISEKNPGVVDIKSPVELGNMKMQTSLNWKHFHVGPFPRSPPLRTEGRPFVKQKVVTASEAKLCRWEDSFL